MSENENLLITLSGTSPPQKNVPRNLNEQDMLLYTAWAHGMSIGDVAHRSALNAFVRSHIANKAEESLQRAIENSPYWQRVSPGKYALNFSGYNRITQFFGHLLPKRDVNCKYVFNRVYAGREYSVLVDPIVGKLHPRIDGSDISGVKACSELEDKGAIFNVKSSSKTSKLLNWISQDSNYSWRRIDIKSVPQTQEIESKISIEVTKIQVEDDEVAFPEGKEMLV